RGLGAAARRTAGRPTSSRLRPGLARGTLRSAPEAHLGRRWQAGPVNEPAARIRDLVRTYGSGDALVRALDGVSLDLEAGQFTAIMGPSGSGKSTLMHCAAALDRADSGTVHIGDQEITRLGDRALTRLRRDRIGFVFQSYNLIPTLTAEENIRLPQAIARRKPDAV